MSEIASPGYRGGMKERSRVRAVVRAFGFGCLMTAAGLAGYVSWLLWGTGLETARAQDQLRTEATPLFEGPLPAEEQERFARACPSLYQRGPDGITRLSIRNGTISLVDLAREGYGGVASERLGCI